jgi:hypothetical protein
MQRRGSGCSQVSPKHSVLHCSLRVSTSVLVGFSPGSACDSRRSKCSGMKTLFVLLTEARKPAAVCQCGFVLGIDPSMPSNVIYRSTYGIGARKPTRLQSFFSSQCPKSRHRSLAWSLRIRPEFFRYLDLDATRLTIPSLDNPSHPRVMNHQGKRRLRRA